MDNEQRRLWKAASIVNMDTMLVALSLPLHPGNPVHGHAHLAFLS
jgi:hypothetical protein